MEFQQAVTETIENAARDVANQLSKPESLEKLEQFKRKIARKKGTVESQLRNTIQTQLDGVHSGLAKLKESEAVIHEIRDKMAEVGHMYKQCAELTEVVNPIKDVNRKYRQLQATTTHINNIFSVPNGVRQTRELIEAGDLLPAHGILSELEHTRDELLVQLFLSEESFVEKNTSLHHYFEPLSGLSDFLGQQLWLRINDTFKLIAEEPRKIVTALRIIEREEKIDKSVAELLKEENIPASHIQGRPKRWREKCMEILETVIINKCTEVVPADRLTSPDEWIRDYLSSMASICFQCLDVIKKHGPKCFPPSYDIFTTCLRWFHENLRNVIGNLISSDLNSRDTSTLIIWIIDLKESFKQALSIDFDSVGPMISQEQHDEMVKICLEEEVRQTLTLVKEMMDEEFKFWCGSQGPDTDITGICYTSVTISLFQMVDQHLEAFTQMGRNIKLQLLERLIGVLIEFQDKYRARAEDYITQHSNAPLFFPFIIAIANNCKQAIDFTAQLKQRACVEYNATTLKREIEEGFKVLTEKFDEIGIHCCDLLLDAVFADMKPLLDNLFSKDEWLPQDHPHKLFLNIERTLTEHNTQGFVHLKQQYHSYIIVCALDRLVKAYLQGMLERRLVLKKDKERETAARLIQEEVRKLSSMFSKLSHATNTKHIGVIEKLSELVRVKQEGLVLEITALAHHYPNLRANHIIAVLAMRGDLNKNSAKKIMEQTPYSSDNLENSRPQQAGAVKKNDEASLLQSLNVPNPYGMFR
ncbi:hypothetical protein EMCRGX_G028561 [Ephydatia muelleri]